MSNPNKRSQTVRAPMGHARLITLFMIVCILLAYSFLLFENNAENDDSSFTKVAAIVYFTLIMAIGLLSYSLNARSLGLLVLACVYMFVNYLRFGVGIKNDIVTVCVLAFLMIARKISLPRKYSAYTLLALILPFVLIVLAGRAGKDGYFVSSLFPKMHINPNTMSQLLLVNLFAVILLIGKRKFGLIHLLAYAVAFVLSYGYASRTGMLCLAVLLVGHLLACSKMRVRTFYRLFVAALIGSFVVVFVYAYWLPSIFSADFMIFGKRLFTGRQWIYKEVIGFIASSPVTVLFGYGFMNFVSASGVLLNAHNYWLQIWMQYGIVFLIPLLVAFGKTVRCVSKTFEKTTAKLFLSYCLCLVLFCMLEALFTGRSLSVIFFMPLLVVRNFARPRKALPEKRPDGKKEKNSAAARVAERGS